MPVEMEDQSAAKKERQKRPNLCTDQYERLARSEGAKVIAGLDEVGTGSLIHVLSVGAVCLPENHGIVGLNDSKRLSAKKREHLAAEIKEKAISWFIADVDAKIIDEFNIARAREMAFEEAVHGLSVVPDFLLIDSVKIDIPCRQYSIDHGDALSHSIAAASIIAKVHRDKLMADLDLLYPGYGLAEHAGYGTAAHLAALKSLGPTELHRFSFRPVREAARMWPKQRR